MGLIVRIPLVRSTWYTRVAEPAVVLTSTAAAVAPPATVIVNALFVSPVATRPSGSRDGITTVAEAAQPLALAGSFHTA